MTETTQDRDDRPIIELLREWAVLSNIAHTKLDRLLWILKPILTELPLSSKTFLNTNGAKYHIKVVENKDGSKSEYVYFSIKNGLENCINVELHPDGKIKLHIGIDGLPLHQSSSTEFWVILGKPHSDLDLYQPFPIAINSGSGKPENLEVFLDDLVNELNELLENGVTIRNKHFEVEIKCFVCDTPARALIKGTKSHTGFFSCERCNTRGESIETKKGSKVVFPGIGDERTDETFRHQVQEDHHVKTSVFTKIRPKFFDFIKLFVLDFMHLICIGAMKRLFERWLVVKSHNRMSLQQKTLLSRRMENLRKNVPVEFQRKPRSTSIFSKWKATEFRFFLLYAGPVVLKGLLKEHLYRHFLLLHTACRILCSNELVQKYKDKAKSFLIAFFFSAIKFYGKTIAVMNIHNLLHVADDAINMNCSLSMISAFPFENMLGKIKRLIRSGNRPLAQVCRRLHEQFFYRNNIPAIPKKIEILKRDKKNKNKILKLKYNRFTLTNKSPDNIVLLKNNTCFKITGIFIDGDDFSSIKLSGIKLKKISSLYQYPMNSDIFETWRIELNERDNNFVQEPIKNVKKKMVLFELSEREKKEFFVMPLLH